MFTDGSFEFEKVTRGGSQKVALQRIGADERGGKVHIGDCYGFDLLHCVSIAGRHCTNFDRVRYFYIIPEEDQTLQRLRRRQPETIHVEFYADG